MQRSGNAFVTFVRSYVFPSIHLWHKSTPKVVWMYACVCCSNSLGLLAKWLDGLQLSWMVRWSIQGTRAAAMLVNSWLPGWLYGCSCECVFRSTRRNVYLFMAGMESLGSPVQCFFFLWVGWLSPLSVILGEMLSTSTGYNRALVNVWMKNISRWMDVSVCLHVARAL